MESFNESHTASEKWSLRRCNRTAYHHDFSYSSALALTRHQIILGLFSYVFCDIFAAFNGKVQSVRNVLQIWTKRVSAAFLRPRQRSIIGLFCKNSQLLTKHASVYDMKIKVRKTEGHKTIKIQNAIKAKPK